MNPNFDANVQKLSDELAEAVRALDPYKCAMRDYQSKYKFSAFFPPLPGQPIPTDASAHNFLKLFADKNIEYLSSLPLFKVPTSGPSPDERQSASLRERIIYAAHTANNTDVLSRQYAEDFTIRSIAFQETGFDIKTRRVFMRRHNPLTCWWKMATNESTPRISVFWIVTSITKEAAFKMYGAQPTADFLATENLPNDPRLDLIDGQDRFTDAIRLDGKTRTHWVGNHLVEEPHNHMQESIPIDVCMPISDAEHDDRGGFFIDPLVLLQAELNDLVYRRKKIVRRLSNPLVWSNNTNKSAIEQIRDQVEKPGGGFVGLPGTAQMGILALQDTKMLDEAEQSIITTMMRLSGYGNASFGENVGANTSGDALGMYFNATQRKVENQNIAIKAFWQSVNARVLRLIEIFGLPGETLQASGYCPSPTLLTSTDDTGQRYMTGQVHRGGFSENYTRTAIAGNYNNLAIPKSATPKNEIEEKRLAQTGVESGFMSRTTAYEAYGLLDPEAELALLKSEQAEPLLNPDVTNTILSGGSKLPNENDPANVESARVDAAKARNRSRRGR